MIGWKTGVRNFNQSQGVVKKTRITFDTQSKSALLQKTFYNHVSELTQCWNQLCPVNPFKSMWHHRRNRRILKIFSNLVQLIIMFWTFKKCNKNRGHFAGFCTTWIAINSNYTTRNVFLRNPRNQKWELVIITYGDFDIADPSSMQDACHNELSKYGNSKLCTDDRNKIKVPDPVVKDLTSKK